MLLLLMLVLMVTPLRIEVEVIEMEQTRRVSGVVLRGGLLRLCGVTWQWLFLVSSFARFLCSCSSDRGELHVHE